MIKAITKLTVLLTLTCNFSWCQNLTTFTRYGLKDSTGKIIVEPIYDFIDYQFRDGITLVRRENKWGAINFKGIEVIPTEYDFADYSGKGIKVQKGKDWPNQKFGFYNKSGELILDTVYKDFWFNKYSIAVISNKDNKRGLINSEGIIISPVIHNNIEFSSDDSPIGLVNESEGKYFYIDSTGKKMGRVYEEAGLFYKGIALVKLNNKWGLINEKMKITIPVKYDESFFFTSGIAKVKVNGKYGLISATGKEIVSFKFDFIDINSSFKVLDVAVYDKQARLSHGLLSFSGKEIIPVKYYSISMVDSTLIAVTTLRVSLNENTGEPWNTFTLGFTNKYGKEVIPSRYEERWNTIANIKGHASALIVTLNNKQGIINYTGRELVPFLYDNFKVPEYNPDNLYGIAVFQSNKIGIMNRNGELISPIKYDDINYDFDGHGICKYALIKKDDKWGCLNNTTGKELIAPKYDKIQFIGIYNDPDFDTSDIASVKYCLVNVGLRTDTVYSYDDFNKLNSDNNWEVISETYLNDTTRQIIIKGGGKWGLVDFNGNELTPIKYENSRMYFHEGLLPVKFNGKWGYINEQGKEVIPTIYDPFDYDVIHYFTPEGTAWVKLGDRQFNIDKNGHEIK